MFRMWIAGTSNVYQFYKVVVHLEGPERRAKRAPSSPVVLLEGLQSGGKKCSIAKHTFYSVYEEVQCKVEIALSFLDVGLAIMYSWVYPDALQLLWSQGKMSEYFPSICHKEKTRGSTICLMEQLFFRRKTHFLCSLFTPCQLLQTRCL